MRRQSSKRLSGQLVCVSFSEGDIRWTLIEQLFQSGDVTAILMRQDVTVDVEGHGDAGVPEPGLHHLGWNAPSKVQTRKGMAQVMAPYPAELGVPAQAGDKSGQGVRMKRPPVEVGEDPVVLCGDLRQC